MGQCIFCKIANKEMPAEIVYENDKIIAFRDIRPVAPLHLLIIPRKHIVSVDHLRLEGNKCPNRSDSDIEIIGELFLVAQKIAKEKGVAKTGYRLIFNVGKDAGQTVDHLHLHLLGGEKLPLA